MKIYDISVAISLDLPVYPGDPGITVLPILSMEKGNHCNLTGLSLGSHTGTHVDAPRHFEPGGLTVDELDLNRLMGPAWVLKISSQQEIGRADLESQDLKGKERVLLKTSNSALWNRREFANNYVHLSQEGAAYLVEMGVKLVGIDYLSIEKYGSTDYGAHHTLLRAGVIILEGINLGSVEPGRYELLCLPLKVRGGEGAPARALLLQR